MEQYLPVLLILAMVATFIVLVIGIVSFGVSGKFYQKNANLIMRARVVMQGIALAIFALITWLAVNG
jgi:hypothetical protein